MWLVDVADTTHATLETYVIHFVNWLTSLLHDTQMTILVHSCNFTLESVQKIRSFISRLHCALFISILYNTICGFNYLISLFFLIN